MSSDSVQLKSGIGAPLKTEDVAELAIEMFNKIGPAHNDCVEQFGKQGVSPTYAAIASYIALRAMISKFEDSLKSIVDPDGWKAIELVIRVMSQRNDPNARATQPEAKA